MVTKNKKPFIESNEIKEQNIGSNIKVEKEEVEDKDSTDIDYMENIDTTGNKPERVFEVRRIEGINIFAVDKNGVYVMLKKQDEYLNTKFGDTIIL